MSIDELVKFFEGCKKRKLTEGEKAILYEETAKKIIYLKEFRKIMQNIDPIKEPEKYVTLSRELDRRFCNGIISVMLDEFLKQGSLDLFLETTLEKRRIKVKKVANGII